jgi:hypothetical protein
MGQLLRSSAKTAYAIRGELRDRSFRSLQLTKMVRYQREIGNQVAQTAVCRGHVDGAEGALQQGPHANRGSRYHSVESASTFATR